MKIQIDTQEKVIRLEADENFGVFMDAIKKLLPNGAWKEYTLETNSIIYWNNPTYIDYTPNYPYYPSPSVDPLITFGDSRYNVVLS